MPPETGIKTQAQLEDLLNDKEVDPSTGLPKKLADAMRGVMREGLEGDHATYKAEMAEAIAKEAAERLQKDPTFANRPMPKGVEIDPKGLEEGTFKSAWGFDSAPLFKAATRRAARSLNGSFDGFNEFLYGMHPKVVERAGLDEARYKALGESAGADGGFLVPDEFSANLMTMALEEAVMRPRAQRIPMTSLTQRYPAIRDTSHASTVYGGVSAYWVPEAGSLTSSQPTFSQIALTAKKLTGYTVIGNELLADSAIGLEAVINNLFPSALAYFEDDAFLNGVGAGQPLGILNAGAMITVTKETGQAAATIVTENIDKMYARMLPSSVNRAVWIANTDTKPQLLSLVRNVGTGGAPVMQMNIQSSPDFTIHGRPVIFTEKVPTLGTAGDIMFVDPRYYLIGDRMALEMAASQHVAFTTDQTVYRFVQRLDGRPWLDSALTPRYGSNTLSPFVSLATRS